MARRGTKDRILVRARRLLAEGGNPTVAQLADAAGVSRASFYRAFESKESLFEELDVTPEPGARERVLATAMEMIGASGLATLSMDDLATRSEVSRATLYRLFPGKSALFTSLIYEFSPLEPVVRVVASMQDEPPEVVMPHIARTVYGVFSRGGESRTGLLRALLFEVSALSPETEEAAAAAVRTVVGSLAGYLASQMARGRIRRTSPLLALQSFIGPIFFHLMTRPVAARVLGMDLGEAAVIELADTWLRGMRP